MQYRLAVDIGNTRTKLGLFREKELLHSVVLKNNSLAINNQVFSNYNIQSCIVSSVNKEAEQILNMEQFGFEMLYLKTDTALPILIDYESPQTLGKDRIAAVVGAQQLLPAKNLLIIDAGSCITYDFLTADKRYLGGAISPGVQMRLRSMNSYTSQLPLLNWEGEKRPQNIGRTTITSMLSGVVNGLIGEMKSFISEYEQQYKQLKIVITGGDSIFFEKELKNGIFADPNLVLKGLNEILIYNNE